MTNIERMAKEAELADEFGRPLPAYPRRLAKFAALVADDAAKEAALFIIRKNSIHPDIEFDQMSDDARMIAHTTCQYVAEAIRAKFALSGGEAK